jgi:hypothetical protein
MGRHVRLLVVVTDYAYVRDCAAVHDAMPDMQAGGIKSRLFLPFDDESDGPARLVRLDAGLRLCGGTVHSP